MTATETENTLHKALAESPSDMTILGALADFLEEVGDPRAGGYRMMWRLELSPAWLNCSTTSKSLRDWYCWGSLANDNYHSGRDWVGGRSWRSSHIRQALPQAVADLIPYVHESDHRDGPKGAMIWIRRKTHREMLKIVAEAWLKVPPEEQERILSVGPLY